MKELIYEQVEAIYVWVLKRGLNIKLNENKEIVMWDDKHHITIKSLREWEADNEKVGISYVYDVDGMRRWGK